MAVSGNLDGDGCNASNSSSGENSVGCTGWTEFCERHARAAASDFAKSCVHYINKNLPENVRTSVSHKDFMMKYIECFSGNFNSEFSRRRHQKVKYVNLLNSFISSLEL